MPRGLKLLVLVVLAAAAGAPAQDGPGEAWERLLDGEARLVQRIKALRSGLEERDVPAVAAQFRPGKVLIVMAEPPLPASLYGPSQAQALLADLLDRRGEPGLRVGLLRRLPEAPRVHVALDALRASDGGGRGRRRFVAVYDRYGADWRLAELRCL